MVRRRLDTELVRRGLALSREHARQLVADGSVLVAGSLADKSGRLVGEDQPLVVQGPSRRFVSRGGEKLEAALERFAVRVAGRHALDAGASTGGFTDCLLQRDVAKVVAVDVGYGQIHPTLRHDERVTVLERTNIRHLTPEMAGGRFDLVVADLSFISLQTVVPNLAGPMAVDGADLVVLVKPQFEAGQQAASKGKGVIRDPALRRQAIEGVASALRGAGASIMGAMASPVLGPAGNVEFFLHALAHHQGATGDEDRLAELLDAALAESPD